MTENGNDNGGLLQEIINKKHEERLKISLSHKKRKELKKINSKNNIIKEDLAKKNNQEKMDSIRNKFYRTSFKFYDKKESLNITYKYQTESKNYMYFICSLRPSCQGACRINKLYSKLEITHRCNFEVDHNVLTNEEFNSLADKKEFDKIDFNNDKHQSMFVEYTIKKSLANENSDIQELFKKETGKDLNLRSHEISAIRTRITNSLNELSVEEIIEKITEKNLNINAIVKSFNAEYQSEESLQKNPNDIVKDKIGKIIIFGENDQITFLNNENIEEYYFDTSFKIIQKKLQYYKFFIISGYDKSDNKTKICAFIFLENPDTICFSKALKYLNEEFNFNPKIIHTDFDNELHS